jgi:PAS domain S-box-containing protein
MGLWHGLKQFKEILNRIKEALKNQPRGLTITEISSTIGLNRNSTARYLDVLLISGQVDMKSVGSAKVYFLSPRVPIDAVLDLSQEGILMLSPSLHIIRVNDAFAKLVHMEVQELVGANIESTEPSPFFDDTVRLSIQNAIRGKQVSYETQMNMDHRMLYIQLKFVPTIFDDGTAGATIIAEDISIRKDAEVKLRKQSDFLSLVMESVAHPFYVIDANDYSIKMANKAARLGTLTPDSTCYALTHGSSKPCADNVHPCPLKEVKSSGKPVVVEHIHHHVSGRTQHLEIHAHPIFDDNGNVVQMIEYNLDITERKQIVGELENHLEALNLIINNISEGKLIVQEKQIIYANDAFAMLVEREQDDIAGSELKRYVEARFLKQMRIHDSTNANEARIELVTSRGVSIGATVQGLRIEYNNKPAELYSIRKLDSSE